MNTYEYKFVKIEATAHVFNFKNVKPKEDYHHIIEQQSRDGWRLVQIFAPPVKGYGLVDFYELIFEREIGTPATNHYHN